MASKLDNANAWEARLERASAYALYLHVPFCAQKCSYCDFASWATRKGDPLMSAYTDALVSQVRELEDLGALEGLRTSLHRWRHTIASGGACAWAPRGACVRFGP